MEICEPVGRSLRQMVSSAVFRSATCGTAGAGVERGVLSAVAFGCVVGIALDAVESLAAVSGAAG